jgi:hypothetical protein
MQGRTYRLVVEGELGDHIAVAFDGMALTNQGGNAVLIGPIRDQAELQGVLQRISDLGLSLLSASVLDQEDGR